MAEKISKLILVSGGKEYELDGGGGGKPGPDSVGTDEIIDGSVEARDLSDDVKDKMTHHYDQQGEGIVLGGIVADNSQDVGQGGGEDSDDEAGFDAGAENGDEDI